MTTLIHIDGSGSDLSHVDELNELYAELVKSDVEHGKVSVIDDDSAWCISVHRNGLVILENLNNAGAMNLQNVSREDVVHILRQLIDSQIDSIRSLL
jgi:hypothetical protein